MHIHHKWSHYFGITASTLCLIHCLALPLVTPLLPFLHLSHNDFVYELVFIALISLSTITIYKGYREHKEPRSLYLGLAGFLVLVLSLFFPHNSLQIAISVCGSLLMAIAHYTNYKLCKVAPCCEHH